MTLYVADTLVLVWWFSGNQKKVGHRARRVLSRFATGTDTLAISAVSLWELALLQESGALSLGEGYAAFVDGLVRAGVRIEAMTVGDVEEARGLPGLVDPHDRLIAGLSLRLKAPLLTADRRIAGDRRVRVVW